MQHRPRKRFGQNFLEDAYIIQKILDAIHPRAKDNILEIGPGLGALTKPLLTQVDKLTAIELDIDLHQHLKQLAPQKLTCIQADALSVDLSQFGEHLRVVGNLPYNISTPLLFHLLEHVTLIQDMHFMLQAEVVNRLAASPSTKAYGRLTVMVQALCHVEPLFEVPPEAFRPPPKVQSAIVRLTPRTTRPPREVLEALEALLPQAFSMRRKTIANNLKPLFSEDALSNLGIDPKRRPETLSIEEYLKLAKMLVK